MKFLDRVFFQEGHKSWFSFIYSSAKKYKINLPNCSINETPKMIADFYKKSTEDQLDIFQTSPLIRNSTPLLNVTKNLIYKNIWMITFQNLW